MLEPPDPVLHIGTPGTSHGLASFGLLLDPRSHGAFVRKTWECWDRDNVNPGLINHSL